MTKLYIDNQEVSLSENMELEFFTQNPFFTRSGEFTYDIDIDLRDPNNRKIYKNINRDDVDYRPQNRHAVLIANNRPIIDGIEIILSVEDELVKIQIASGNSRLNYLSGGDKKLREMNLGLHPINKTSAMDSTFGCFPEYTYACPLVQTGFATYEGAKVKGYNTMHHVSKDNAYPVWDDNVQLCAQPYLLAIMEMVVGAMGYNVGINQLADIERFRKLIIVNGDPTDDWAKKLPDWTIDEFLNETEAFFNCIYLIREDNKTVDILFRYNYYKNAKEVTIKDVIADNKEKIFDATADNYFDYTKVQFDFPSTQQYQYDSIDKKILELMERKNVNVANDLMPIPKEDEDKRWLVHSTLHNIDYVQAKGEGGAKTIFYYQMANRFKGMADNREDEESLKLKIVPSEITAKTFIENQKFVTAPCAFVRSKNCMDDKTEKMGVSEMVRSGVPEDSAGDRMYVAVYIGYRPYFIPELWPDQLSGAKHPMTITDEYINFETDKYVVQMYVPGEFSLNLRIQGQFGLFEEYYKQSIAINQSIEYKFSFLTEQILDTKSIFVIRNKKYYCKEIRYQVNSDGIEKIAEGTFYRITNQ